jgi:uncharacterized membrane protein
MKKIRTILLIVFSILVLGLFASTTTNSTKKEIIVEEELIFEDWMTKPFPIQEQIVEEPLEVEDWMTKPFTWNGQ